MSFISEADLRAAQERFHRAPENPPKPVCLTCGKRRGLHKWGTAQCPNSDWLAAPGYGAEQWLSTTFAWRNP